MSTIKVLVVEDKMVMHKIWRDELGDKVMIISAFTVEQGEALFMASADLSAIVMDACVPGYEPTTLPLTRRMRETFQGPMIAVSSDPKYRQKLMKAGCDHSCSKEDLPQHLMEILNLESAHAH